MSSTAGMCIVFREDFAFQLLQSEWEALRSQIATSKGGRGSHRKYLPVAFTEHGALMVANILNSSRAVAMSVYVIRAFVNMRGELTANAAILKRLAEIDKTLLIHDVALREIFEKLPPLLALPPVPPKPEIGFHVQRSPPSLTASGSEQRLEQKAGTLDSGPWTLDFFALAYILKRGKKTSTGPGKERQLPPDRRLSQPHHGVRLGRFGARLARGTRLGARGSHRCRKTQSQTCRDALGRALSPGHHLVNPGVNRLSVAVTSTWFNRLSFDAGIVWTNRRGRRGRLAGPPRTGQLRPAGLLGPVAVRLGHT